MHTAWFYNNVITKVAADAFLSWSKVTQLHLQVSPLPLPPLHLHPQMLRPYLTVACSLDKKPSRTWIMVLRSRCKLHEEKVPVLT